MVLMFNTLEQRLEFLVKQGWAHWLTQPCWIPVKADDPKRTQGYVFHSEECDRRHQDGRAEERASRTKGAHPGCQRLFTAPMTYAELIDLAEQHPHLEISSTLCFDHPIYWDARQDSELLVVDFDRIKERGNQFHPLAQQLMEFLRDDCHDSVVWERSLSPGNYHAIVRVTEVDYKIPDLPVKLADPNRARKRWKIIPIAEFRCRSGSYIYLTHDLAQSGSHNLQPLPWFQFRNMVEKLRGDGIPPWP